MKQFVIITTILVGFWAFAQSTKDSVEVKNVMSSTASVVTHGVIGAE